MWYTKDINLEIQKISKKYNMSVYVIDAKEWVRRGLWKYGFNLTKSGGPKVFLSMVKNASLVFTSSFHGTIFSAIFQKNFWYIKNKSANVNDDRACFILEQLGLKKRYIRIDNICKVNLWEQIDFLTVEENINKLKTKSIEFLKESLM
jgi:exopolysaccharide biosynthesis predicted pyruvyltransferase EpsI